jgi:glycine/D-amino acid oxidase-like deaminating enzyme/N-acetylglutamate synthase-like GNAT family acetyltransferase
MTGAADAQTDAQAGVTPGVRAEPSGAAEPAAARAATRAAAKAAARAATRAAAARPLWWDALPPAPERPPLDGDAATDVVIVGGGFTGLWTAYYLKRADPSLAVRVLERHHVGFGASGRNGGWCHAAYPLGLATLARDHGDAEAVRFMRALFATLDEIERVLRDERIECHFSRGGSVNLACSELQLARARADVEEEHAIGLGEDDVRLLDAAEARAMVGAAGALGASYSPHAAAVQPALLAHGLAAACERIGIVIHEGTSALDLGPGAVRTARGTLRARTVLRATEAYTRDLRGQRRTLVPLHSLMIATEPLPAPLWEELGMARRTTFGDYGHSLIYGQRTADDRLAFGGRGAPYRFGSGIAHGFGAYAGVHADLAVVLGRLFPEIRPYAFTHRWGGVLAVSRDWRPSVGFSASSGVGWAGGYVGDGVATSNLAGRTLADLALGRASELTTLPWVHHPWRAWEPEPLRYVGINAGLWLARSADRQEARTGKPSWRADLGNWLRGKRRRPERGVPVAMRPAGTADLDTIRDVINEAAVAYKGVIAADCWHEPYMGRHELEREVAEGVIFWVREERGRIVAVMGLQRVHDVALIRHAYTRPPHQHRGHGVALLSHIRRQTGDPMLVGTWRAAEWAVRFYQARGFRSVDEEQTERLLRRYWSVPERQMKESIVLADERWLASAGAPVPGAP